MASSITFKYKSFLSRSISPMDETLTGMTTQSQSEPGSNGNKGVFDYHLISKTEASPSDAVSSHTQNTSFF